MTNPAYRFDPMGPVVATVDPVSMGAGDQNYAVPTYGTNAAAYEDAPLGAYSPKLEFQPGSTPDPSRNQTIARRDYRPEPEHFPGYFWTGVTGPGTERMIRHRVEFLDADGKEANKPHAGQSAPDPRWVPPAEPRVTNRLSPSTWVFTRPFDQTIERRLNGEHFSMADHRRAFPILGMQPPGYKRNTYRTDPIPWDAHRTDMPNQEGSVTPGRIVAYDLPPSGDQSWRLR